MLFLVFDIELVLLLPVSLSLSLINFYGFIISLIFFIVLTVGFILEIGSNAITTSNTKIDNPNNNLKSIISIPNNQIDQYKKSFNIILFPRQITQNPFISKLQLKLKLMLITLSKINLN
jgi:hypothetical protein